MELDPAGWAEQPFGRAAFGDVRRIRRVVAIARAMPSNPRASLPQQLPDWARLKAAYRVLDEAEGSHAARLAPHWEQTRAAARQGAVMLLVQDTTEVDFTAHPKTHGLGPIGTGGGAGILGQSVLAIEPPTRQVLGLAYEEPFLPQRAPKGASRAQAGRKRGAAAGAGAGVAGMAGVHRGGRRPSTR